MVFLPSTVLYKYSGSDPFTVLSHQYEGEPFPPISTPWGSYKSACHTFGTTTLNHTPTQPYIPNTPHPRQVEVQ